MNIKKTRHILLFSLTLLLFSTQGYSQRKDIDFGLLLGTIQYNGDVNMTRAYTSPRPAIALIFRKNYNPHYSLRFDATFGRLACKDENFHNNYQQNRDYSFDDSRVMELTGMVEFNFFEVTTNKKEKNLHKAGFNYVNYIALVTLPDLMHLVHTFFLVTVPFSSTFTV